MDSPSICTDHSVHAYSLPSSVIPSKDNLKALPSLSLKKVSTFDALLLGRLTDILQEDVVKFIVYLLARPSTPLSPNLDIFKAGTSVIELSHAGTSGIKGKGMINVKLEGELADLFIDTIDLAVSSVGEALRALKANFSGFFDYLEKSSSRGVYYKVYVGHQQIGEKELICPIAKKVRSIRIVPIFMGAGGEGTQWWQILTGVGLIAAAFLLPATFGISLLGGKILTPLTIGLIGAGLLLSGIMSIFQPQKEPTKEEKQSNSFDPVENAGEGGRMPIVYGIMMVGITPISVKLDSNVVGA